MLTCGWGTAFQPYAVIATLRRLHSSLKRLEACLLRCAGSISDFSILQESFHHAPLSLQVLLQPTAIELIKCNRMCNTISAIKVAEAIYVLAFLKRLALYSLQKNNSNGIWKGIPVIAE